MKPSAIQTLAQAYEDCDKIGAGNSASPCGSWRRYRQALLKSTELESSNIQTCKNSSFRKDINGLRAWAVVAVVLYHFGIASISGGFSGVDVFFVISGFLMTGIIIEAQERGQFSLLSFYLARARRILPALIFLCLVLLLFGWFLLLPGEYEKLGKHAYKTLLFSSNLTYLKESGYFDIGSHDKWLLHTWSLSVEWQFYILQPLILIAVWKLSTSRKIAFIVMAAITIASLFACIKSTSYNPSFAFYSIWTRAWEMLLGGLVFILSQQVKFSTSCRKWLEYLGFSLIIFSFLYFSPSSQWPGTGVLFPTVGASLVLISNNDSSILTRTQIAQWLGTRSYSIYLWHWPVVVILAYWEILNNPTWALIGILSSVLLGSLSYKLVEVPTGRHLKNIKDKYACAFIVLVLILCLAPARMIRLNDGYPSRINEEIVEIEAQARNYDPRGGECQKADANCIYGGETVSAVLLGDSHAGAIASAISASISDKNRGVLLRAVPGCYISFGAKNLAPDCEKLNRDIKSSLEKEYLDVPVIVMTRASEEIFGGGKPRILFSNDHDEFNQEYLEELTKDYVTTACELAKQHPLYLVRPIPELKQNPATAMARSILWGFSLEIPHITLNEYHTRHELVWSMQDRASKQCGAHILNPLNYLCDNVSCYGAHNGLPTYFNADHINEYGNKLLVPMLSDIFKPVK